MAGIDSGGVVRAISIITQSRIHELVREYLSNQRIIDAGVMDVAQGNEGWWYGDD